MTPYISFSLNFAITTFLISWLPTTNGAAAGLIDDPEEPLMYVELDEHYRIYQKKLSWMFALQFCTSCWGTFATFESPAEANRVRELLYSISVFSEKYDHGAIKSQFGLDRPYWFGLTDESHEGKWVWKKSVMSDSVKLEKIHSFKWYPGQPDHNRTKIPEHCGGFWNPVYHLDTVKTGGPPTGNSTGPRKELHTFNDFPCERQMYFICRAVEGTVEGKAPECEATKNTNITANAAPAAPASTPTNTTVAPPAAANATVSPAANVTVPPTPQPPAVVNATAPSTDANMTVTDEEADGNATVVDDDIGDGNATAIEEEIDGNATITDETIGGNATVPVANATIPAANETAQANATTIPVAAANSTANATEIDDTVDGNATVTDEEVDGNSTLTDEAIDANATIPGGNETLNATTPEANVTVTDEDVGANDTVTDETVDANATLPANATIPAANETIQANATATAGNETIVDDAGDDGNVTVTDEEVDGNSTVTDEEIDGNTTIAGAANETVSANATVPSGNATANETAPRNTSLVQGARNIKPAPKNITHVENVTPLETNTTSTQNATEAVAANATSQAAGNKTEYTLGTPYTPDEMKNAREINLNWHNIMRQWHGAPLMVLDEELNKKAQAAAEYCVGIGKMEHTSGGENLYIAGHEAGDRRFSPTEHSEKAAKSWYFELCENDRWPYGELNHFSQLVWVESVKLGVGIATNNVNSQIHVVTRYDPIGNYEGEFDFGVGKLRCPRENLCDGLLPKNITGIENCPGVGKPAGRAFKKKKRNGTRNIVLIPGYDAREFDTKINLKQGNATKPITKAKPKPKNKNKSKHTPPKPKSKELPKTTPTSKPTSKPKELPKTTPKPLLNTKNITSVKIG